MKTVSRTPLLTLVCVSLLTHTLSAQDHVWPQFRGPNCSGIAAEGEKPPITFGPQSKVLWKTPLPLGHSSPCIWGDRIFVTGCDRSKKELYVVCVDRKTGSIRWEKTIAVEQFYKANGMNNAASATATTDGERVYAYFSSYEIACYDNEGNPVWSQSLPDPQ
jgi:outer membrane protein assembly factor BamB